MGCPGCLLKDPNIIKQINFYNDYQLMGWPFAPMGWGDHPAWMVDVVRVIEREKSIIRNTKRSE